MSENKLGLSKSDYKGANSTLCTGCGHDSVTNHIITAYFEHDIPPHKVAKVSGIGCSSKTPTYFLNQAHGFNSLHGRMAPLAIGSKVANYDLNLIGISGDGDSASIGLGGLAHLIRRNLPIVYIIENNGVYGLTKGQFSATADPGSLNKSGEKNPFTTIDLCSFALDLGCSFVARSFSGDGKHLVALLKAAISHSGTAIIDVVSPCITFANNDGSTKSYNYVKEHKKELQELGYIGPEEPIEVDIKDGESQTIQLHDESQLKLRKLDPRAHDVNNPLAAYNVLHTARHCGEILTGLFYHNSKAQDFGKTLDLPSTPLAHLGPEDLRPNKASLDEILSSFT